MENPFEIIVQRLDNIEKILSELSKHLNEPKGNEDSDEIMTVDQLSQYLTIAKQTIYGKCGAREIPHYKTGKRVYFKKSEINEWLIKGRIHTSEEIRKEAEEWIRKHPLKR